MGQIYNAYFHQQEALYIRRATSSVNERPPVDWPGKNIKITRCHLLIVNDLFLFPEEIDFRIQILQYG